MASVPGHATAQGRNRRPQDREGRLACGALPSDLKMQSMGRVQRRGRARIADLHLREPRDWEEIELLYQRLEQITSSPVVRINWAIAVAELGARSEARSARRPSARRLPLLPLHARRSSDASAAALLRTSTRWTAAVASAAVTLGPWDVQTLLAMEANLQYLDLICGADDPVDVARHRAAIRFFPERVTRSHRRCDL